MIRYHISNDYPDAKGMAKLYLDILDYKDWMDEEDFQRFLSSRESLNEGSTITWETEND